MKIIILVLLFFLVFPVTVDEYHVFLFMGQSNATGAATPPAGQKTNENIIKLTRLGTWEIATEPVSMSYPGYSPALAFKFSLTTAIINTGSGELRMSLPIASATISLGNGREDAVVGKQLHGIITSGSAQCRIFDYNNVVPMINGYVINMSASYGW